MTSWGKADPNTWLPQAESGIGKLMLMITILALAFRHLL